MIEEEGHSASKYESPYIFMNQERVNRNEDRTNKFSLNPEMKLNFFNAYQFFMRSLSNYSKSQAAQGSLFDSFDNTFGLPSNQQDDT
jgi:hypothetical protein